MITEEGSMKNVVTLDDIQPEEWTGEKAGHHHGRIWWVFTPDTIGTEGLKMHVQEFDPGGYTDPAEHSRHTEIEQVYYIISGTMTVQINGKEYIAKAGSLVYIPRGAEHGHRNDGHDKLVFLTVNVPVRSGEAPPLP